MKEKNLRNWHGKMGIILAFFIMLQTISGLFITMQQINVPHSHADTSSAVHDTPDENPWPPVVQAAMSAIHHGGGMAGALYRIMIGAGLLWMAMSGSLIYLKIRARNSGSSI